MSNEIRLSPDAEQALAAAQEYCAQMNVAIVAPEHLLAGALAVLEHEGHPGVPRHDLVEAALMSAQGASDEPLTATVMFGSAAREAINFVAAGVRRAGATEITSGHIAAGTILSGEVGPMFYLALGTSRDVLLKALAGE